MIFVWLFIAIVSYAASTIAFMYVLTGRKVWDAN